MAVDTIYMMKSTKDDVRFRFLQVLQDGPNLSQRQIAGELGVSVGAVNYCLRVLIEKGRIVSRKSKMLMRPLGLVLSRIRTLYVAPVT